MPKNRWRIK